MRLVVKLVAVLVLIDAVGTASAYDRTASIHVTLSSTNVQFAQPLEFSVELQSPAALPSDLTTHWQPPNGWFVLDFHQTKPTRTATGLWTTRAVWRLQPEKAGSLVLPAVAWTVNGKNVPAKPVTVTVRSLLPASEQGLVLRDIEEPVVPWKVPWPTHWLLAGLALTIGLGILVAVWLWRRSCTPAAIALRALAELARAGAPTTAEYPRFYHRLFDILRVYLERQFHFPARQCTSRELLQLVTGVVPAPAQEELVTLVQAGDRVRFAHVVLAAGRAEDAIAVVRQLVEQTARRRGGV